MIFENVAFICDLKACIVCSFPKCKHTSDITHAVNFSTINAKYIENSENEEQE